MGTSDKISYFIILMMILMHAKPFAIAENKYDHPGPRFAFAMVYDASNNFVLLYGGTDETMKSKPETWSYNFDNNEWAKYNLDSVPEIKWFHTMIYDPDIKQVVHTSGVNQMWRFNVSTPEWKRVIQLAGPVTRSDYSLYYDTHENKIILFGGVIETSSGGALVRDTWEYDSELNIWSEFPRNTKIGPLYGHSMIYDPVGKIGILVGGNNWDSGTSNTFWTFDYSSRNWTQIQTSNAPDIRYWHYSAFDPNRRQMLIFGGTSHLYAPWGDTWILDCNTFEWKEIKGTGPSGRFLGRMVYNPHSDTIFLYGGQDGQTRALEDSWSFNMTDHTWKELPRMPYFTSSNINDSVFITLMIMIMSLFFCVKYRRRFKIVHT
jgi:hypothetical protein